MSVEHSNAACPWSLETIFLVALDGLFQDVPDPGIPSPRDPPTEKEATDRLLLLASRIKGFRNETRKLLG